MEFAAASTTQWYSSINETTAVDALSGTVTLAQGGTGASLTDPNADRIMFWDASASTVTWLTASTGLTITGTNMTVRTASATQTGIVELATGVETQTGTDTTRAVTPAGFKTAGDLLYAPLSAVGAYTSVREIQIATEGQTVFNLTTFTYVLGVSSINVYINGVKQAIGTAYTETNTSRITFSFGLTLGDIVEFYGLNSLETYTPISITNYTKYETTIVSPTNLIDISPSVYTIGAYQLLVFLNGVKQASGIAYTETSTTTITFAQTLNENDYVEIYITSYITEGTSNNIQAITTTHNNLSGMQGGAIGDYQHITTGERSNWNTVYNWYTSMTTADADNFINTISEILAAFSNASEGLDLANELMSPTNMTFDAGTF
jgi:hypothetical protein